ncbi:hypothetical protein AGMMS49940_23840 [Spirochaetia bacterium]|nr:hypothetical protein AGMMS49940_23840 [Spirochaetia bacterium]
MSIIARRVVNVATFRSRFLLAKPKYEIMMQFMAQKTSYNIRYTLRRSSGLTYEKPQSAQ